MEIKILSPLWGYEQFDLTSFLDRVRMAGYDGIETWIPADRKNKQILLDYLDRYGMPLVAHQYEANGSTFKKFRESFVKNLYKCAQMKPLLINSHTGKDHFSIQQFLDLIVAAEEFSAKTGILVTHETHRGRMGYSPQMTAELFSRNNDFLLTADFSHWTCVTESMLDQFGEVLKQAIARSRHIHARVGYEQGPQVADPRAPEWQYALEKFETWWNNIIDANRKLGRAFLSITTEFGPFPYMPALPFTQKPVAVQFDLNCFIKDRLRQRYP